MSKHNTYIDYPLLNHLLPGCETVTDGFEISSMLLLTLQIDETILWVCILYSDCAVCNVQFAKHLAHNEFSPNQSINQLINVLLNGLTSAWIVFESLFRF